MKKIIIAILLMILLTGCTVGDSPVTETPVSENPIDENPIDESPVTEAPEETKNLMKKR